MTQTQRGEVGRASRRLLDAGLDPARAVEIYTDGSFYAHRGGAAGAGFVIRQGRLGMRGARPLGGVGNSHECELVAVTTALALLAGCARNVNVHTDAGMVVLLLKGGGRPVPAEVAEVLAGFGRVTFSVSRRSDPLIRDCHRLAQQAARTGEPSEEIFRSSQSYGHSRVRRTHRVRREGCRRS